MTFLRNCWYVAGFSEEATQAPLARTFLDEPVVIYRTVDGALVAMDNRCPHRLAPLDKGTVIGSDIRCIYHGLRFSPQGECVHVPSGDPAPSRARLKVYPLVERWEALWIWMGDPALADPKTIPDFAYLVDPGFGWFNGVLYARGNYQLLVDNLLDLSHSEFLHPFLSSDGWTRRNKADISREGDTLHVKNVAENDNILPIMKQMRPDMRDLGTTVQHERWDPPSHCRLSIEYYADGQQIVIPSGHFLTPETATTTHYFVRGGHDVGADDPQFTAAMKAGVLNVFQTQDIPIIEAQQRFLGEADLMDQQPAILAGDGAAIRARRLLAQKIRQEREGAPHAALTAAQ